MDKTTKKHRGRIQAQGDGLEESESWAQDTPLKISKARLLFQRLIAKLSSKDYKKRQKDFEKAQKFAEKASENGGLYAPETRTFITKENNKRGERVDIEIITGKAFEKDK